MDLLRKILRAVIVISAVVMLPGCDFFRTLASRPTSDDIRAKRELIAAEELRRQARIDSLAAVAEREKDSLLLVEKIRSRMVITPAAIGGLAAASLPYRYYIIIGTFSLHQNAEKLSQKASDAGYQSALIGYRNGFTAVGLCPSNSLLDIDGSLKVLRNETFCPKDVWILVNE